MGLQQFEQRLERLVEGAFAKAFGGELQPIEIGKRLTREMDLRRTLSVRGVVTPNRYEIVLAKADFERFGDLIEVLKNQLAEVAREHAHSESYKFLGPVEVGISADEKFDPGKYSISASVHEREGAGGNWLVLANGRRVEVGENPITIGRIPECDIPVSDPNVSRRHAQLRREGESVYLFDLDSTNGTRVNGTPIRQHLLADGEIITIGTTSLRFEAE